MKKLVFTGFISLLSLCLTAQPLLYGLTWQGGTNNQGTLINFDVSTDQITPIYHFDSTNGARPTGSLFQASNGIFYGTTLNGGMNNAGVIFSFNPITLVYNKLFDFSDSIRSSSDFIQVSENKLISTSLAQPGTYGAILLFDISTFQCSVIHRFNGIDGAFPDGKLLKASNGMLYGLTSSGGNRNVGVIFSYDYPSGVYSKLHDFTGSVMPPYDNFDGARPDGSLVEAANGKLYGVTPQGGQMSSGTVFYLDPANNSYSSIFSFPGGIYNPQGHLTRASSGKIYFVSENSSSSLTAGRIWSIDPSSNSVSPVGQFGGPNGYRPLGNGLLQLADGKIYGMTARGSNPYTGPGGNGVVFSFDTTTSIITWRANFNPATGILPFGSFITNSGVQSPLSLVITDFTVKKNGTENTLQWITMNERNVSHIEIERSRNGIDYHLIGRVYSSSNNDASGHYRFSDVYPLNSANYYRLKIIDEDQTYHYSEIKAVNGTAAYSVQLYPNPAPDYVMVQITSDKKSNLKMEILSLDGKILLTTRSDINEGTTVRKIPLASLKKGSYLLKVASLTNDDFIVRFQKL